MNAGLFCTDVDL